MTYKEVLDYWLKNKPIRSGKTLWLMIAKAIEKQIAQKPIRTNISSNAFTVWRRYNCPCCGMFLYSGTGTQPTPQKHCHECGQAINWTEESEK